MQIKNALNHIFLLFFTKMFRSLLWPLSGCLIKRTPCYGHKSDQNKLKKYNNMWLNIFINVH